MRKVRQSRQQRNCSKPQKEAEGSRRSRKSNTLNERKCNTLFQNKNKNVPKSPCTSEDPQQHCPQSPPTCNQLNLLSSEQYPASDINQNEQYQESLQPKTITNEESIAIENTDNGGEPDDINDNLSPQRGQHNNEHYQEKLQPPSLANGDIIAIEDPEDKNWSAPVDNLLDNFSTHKDPNYRFQEVSLVSTVQNSGNSLQYSTVNEQHVSDEVTTIEDSNKCAINQRTVQSECTNCKESDVETAEAMCDKEYQSVADSFSSHRSSVSGQEILPSIPKQNLNEDKMESNGAKSLKDPDPALNLSKLEASNVMSISEPTLSNSPELGLNENKSKLKEAAVSKIQSNSPSTSSTEDILLSNSTENLGVKKKLKFSNSKTKVVKAFKKMFSNESNHETSKKSDKKVKFVNEVLRKDEMPKSAHQNVIEKSLQVTDPNSGEQGVSDEEYIDAPDNFNAGINQRLVNPNQPFSRTENLTLFSSLQETQHDSSKFSVNPNAFNRNQRVRCSCGLTQNEVLSKKSKLYSQDKKQHIKKQLKDGQFLYSGQFVNSYGIFNSSGGLGFKVHGASKLLIADVDDFVARVHVADGPELDFSKSFKCIKGDFLNKRLTIIKILEDTLLDQRNKAYHNFTVNLENRSKNLGTNLNWAEDLLQLSLILKPYKRWLVKPLVILQDIMRNGYISTELRNDTQFFWNLENVLLNRNTYLPKFVPSAMPILQTFTESLRNISKTGIMHHKQELLNKLPKQNSLFLFKVLAINSLSNKKLLYINSKDIKLFTDLDIIANSERNAKVIPSNFMECLWERFHQKIEIAVNQQSLKALGPLTNPIYCFLFKSFCEIILDIQSRLNFLFGLVKDDFFTIANGEFHLAPSITWPAEHPINDSLENQLHLIFELMTHFEPGKYSHENKFNYTYKLLQEYEGRSIWQRVREAFGGDDELHIPEERVIWIYILDCGLAPILSGSHDEHVHKLSHSLLTGFSKFIKEARHDRYETFRIATHNITKFAAQIYPYFSVVDSVSVEIDHSILDLQIDLIRDMLSSEDSSLMLNFFASLMDVYNEYWEHRKLILGEMYDKFPHSIFKEDINAIMITLLVIVNAALSKKVDVPLVIHYFRLYNEFLKHMKGIEFSWLVKKTSLPNDLPDGIVKLVNEESKSYEVTDPEQFIHILSDKQLTMPKHYLIESIQHLLDIINLAFDKENWNDSNCLNAASDLFLAIGHSFIYLKDQAACTDFEYFRDDLKIPYQNVIINSDTYDDFKSRLDNVENFYLYTRKQNKIGITRALELCESEMEKIKNIGFCVEMDRSLLETCYNVFLDKFLYLVNLEISVVIADLKEKLQSENILPFDKWTPAFKQNFLPSILANLAAVWTIQESKDVASRNQRIEPHCVQILCILRLLGVDKQENGIEKHFAQVLTGQGKSIILGLLSTLLAVTGHEVFNICYSKYLAKRDEKYFKTFLKTFDEFNVINNVEYSTIDNMVEKSLDTKVNGQTISFRSLVDDLILNNLEKPTIEIKIADKPSVFLIDEADVFFSDEFYGNTFNPCSNIGMDALLEIQPKIWEIVESGVYELEIVLETINEFINELLKDSKNEKFRNFVSSTNSFFKSNLESMVTSAIILSKNKNSTDEWYVSKYRINDDGIIAYKHRYDIYCPHTYNGYYNVFNYFRLKKTNYEHKNYKNFGYLYLVWGHLSYAIIPKDWPLILGVSGTLTTLDNCEKDAIKKYGINKISIVSSFFGDNNLIFKPMEHFTLLDSEESWFDKIHNHINKQITFETGRAVIVFFKDEFKLDLFKKKFESNIDRLHLLTGNEDSSMLEWYISEAGIAQTVTLATRGMGRGVDYKSNDMSVEALGGIHVIQTFFSLDEKEEVQLKGRTARKNNKGSYELIICKEHLESLECSENSDGSAVNSYMDLCTVRKRLAEIKINTIEEQIKKSEEETNNTMKFLKSISDYTPEKRNDFFSRDPFVKKA